MYCTYPREISIENFSFFLEKLENLYQKDSPKHLVIRSSLQMFIQRFKKFPDLKQRMKLFILSDDWERDGQFFATVIECIIFRYFIIKIFSSAVYLQRMRDFCVFRYFKRESSSADKNIENS